MPDAIWLAKPSVSRVYCSKHDLDCMECFGYEFDYGAFLIWMSLDQDASINSWMIQAAGCFPAN